MQYINMYIESILNTSKSLLLGMCTSVYSFIHSFICYLLDFHPRTGTLNIFGLQQNTKDKSCRYSAYIIFFPSLKRSWIFSFSKEHTSRLSHCCSLKCEALLREILLVVWRSFHTNKPPLLSCGLATSPC